LPNKKGLSPALVGDEAESAQIAKRNSNAENKPFLWQLVFSLAHHFQQFELYSTF
jgi:hypothetical protein